MVKHNDKYDWQVGSRPPPIDPHSIVKHQVLEKYLRAYVRVVMANVNMERLVFTVVDGFAGGGEYMTPEDTVYDGSPVISINAIREAEREINEGRIKARKVDARFYFVEKKQSNFDYLRACLGARELSQGDTTQFFCNDFLTVVDPILEDIKRRRGGERALFLLDQYAYDDVPIPVIRNIFDRVEKAEVLLTFNVDSLTTFLSNTPAFRRKLEQIGLANYIDWGLLDTVSKLQNPNWRAIIQKMLARGIVEESGARFATIFFIRPLGDTPWDYWLVHLSKVFKARDVMMGIHWEHANHFHHHLEPDIFTLGFDASRDPEASRQQLIGFGDEFSFDAEASRRCLEGLADKLTRRLFDDGRSVAFQQLLNDLGNCTPATADMIRDALHQPMLSKDISVVSDDGERRKKGSSIKLDDVIVPGKQRWFQFN